MKGFAVFGLFWLLQAVAPGTVLAQGGQFTSEAAATFGQRVDFKLTAVTTVSITAVTLFVQPERSLDSWSAPVTFAYEADGRLQASYSLRPQDIGLLPFSSLTYWWALQTAAGEILMVPPERIIYEDNRFVWQALTADNVTIRWVGAEVEVGEAAYQSVMMTLPRLQALLPVAPDTPLPITIYPSSADLRSGLRLHGADLVGGHVDPAVGGMMVTAVNNRTAVDDLRRSVPHALTHYLFYQATLTSGQVFPAWFVEGLAGVMAGGLSSHDETVLAAAVEKRTLFSLVELCDAMPPDGEQLAALQSTSLIQFIHTRYGEGALRDLAAAFRGGAGCETAVSQVLGQSLIGLETAWLRAQQPQPAWQQFLYENGFWLLLLLSGFGIMGLLLKR